MKTKMKKLLLAVAITCCYFSGSAQSSVTREQAKSIAANVMANFTVSTSFAYTKGITLAQFKSKLCGKALPVIAGDGLINEAYYCLSKGMTKEQVASQNNGVAVANAFKYLLDQHNKGVEPDGTELFGGKNNLPAADGTARVSDCKWYQFWCLVQDFATWVVNNWPIIAQIIQFIISL
jgi:hypothetical protein